MNLKFKTLFIGLFVLFAVIREIDSSGCADKNPFCPFWKNHCKPGGPYYSLIKERCALSCGFCKVTCDASPCKNGGNCSASGNGVACKCALGFAGKTCEKVDACAHQPCQNGGICKNHRNSFKCKCVDGYEGKWCHKQTKKLPLIGSLKRAKQCKDTRPECAEWRKAGHCREGELLFDIVTDFCPKSCGICKEPVKCGQGPNKAVAFRVVGGNWALPHSWPWQAFIGIKTSGRTSACGGTLIAKRWVMTAGHCLTKRKGIEARHLEVVLGEHNRSKIENTEQYRSVLRIVRHPNYNYDTKDNDIALLELNREVVLNDNVGLACLPTAPPDPGSNCYVTGFGKTDGLSLDTAVTLREALLPVVTNKKCFSVNNDVPVTENMLCAGTHLDVKFTASGCKGDSGGPFVCLKNKIWSVQGVVNWGSSTCLSFERYTVFARVTRHLAWIKQTIS